jgi:pimeloyl-ACP methyl ester carboxylesterase
VPLPDEAPENVPDPDDIPTITPIITPVFVENPAPNVPTIPVVPVVTPVDDVVCAVTGSSEGPVSIGSGSGSGLNGLPPGYTVITSTSVQCGGNYIDITLNVPDNYEDIRAFMRYPDDQEPLSSEVLDSAKCGDEWTQTMRRQQQVAWGGGGAGYQELETITTRQAVFEPTAAERVVSTGDYRVDLSSASLQSSTNVRLSSPTFDVPPAAHPNLVIVGSPLLLAFTPYISGKVRVTMPYAAPAFVEPASVAIYVRVGDQWRHLETSIDTVRQLVWADVGDISLFLDNSGAALFAVMGVTCSACTKVELDRVYDGGSRKAVVLLHGFTTDRLRWQSFIDDVVNTNSDWQVWVASYPLTHDSDDIARELASLLEQRAAEYDKVSFITHSMGGIIVQKALQEARTTPLSWSRKAQDVIMAGQPGLGSPSADVYGRLFGALVNLKSSAMVWNQRSPLLTEAVAGRQIPRAPGAEYFIIAGRQSFPFTYELFKTPNAYLPNDGIISIYSARTVSGEQITDTCRHYFEVPRTHTDLLDDWLPRRVMQRALFRNDA